MSAELNRLRWQCRRGQLELDLCLRRFLDSGYAGLSDDERATFACLLRESDQTLWDWLVESKPVPERGLSGIVAKIRAI